MHTHPLDGASDLVFCATGKSGLGHLRRITNVAAELRRLRPDLNMRLISNAPVAGLSLLERNGFTAFEISPRSDMAELVASHSHAPVVVDTAILPGLEAIEAPLCLILRETVTERVSDFRLPNGRKWDLVCVPNPVDHWMPDVSAIGATRVEATGWIFRQLPRLVKTPPAASAGGQVRILVSSGGGGNADTAAWFKAEVDAILGAARQKSSRTLQVTQVAGPRMAAGALLTGADDILDAGSHLNEYFDQYDLVISTAGYNSVLELAILDVPVLLVPIDRSLDDQSLRSTKWAKSMGKSHHAGKIADTADWIAQMLSRPTRRAPVMLDGHGAMRCAQLIQELLQ